MESKQEVLCLSNCIEGTKKLENSNEKDRISFYKCMNKLV